MMSAAQAIAKSAPSICCARSTPPSCIIPEVQERRGVIDKFISNAALCLFAMKVTADGLWRQPSLAGRVLLMPARPGSAWASSAVACCLAASDRWRTTASIHGDWRRRQQRHLDRHHGHPGEILLPASMPRSLLDLCVTETTDVELQLGSGRAADRVLRVLSWRSDAMGMARTEAFAIPTGEATQGRSPASRSPLPSRCARRGLNPHQSAGQSHRQLIIRR